MILCAGGVESFDFAKSTGIGLVESAMNTTKLILTFCPKKIIFIGSAGSYGSHKIFDIVTSSSASNIESSFFSHASYCPSTNFIASNALSNTNTVNSSNYITTDSSLWNGFKSHDIFLENMEFFSILTCAKHFNIDAIGIFVVTNFCNSNAHSDFITNHQKGMQKLKKYLFENGFVSRETF